jgi:hypothetical protein
MKFDNKISIDGVAVIVACIVFTVWLATMRANVNQNAKDIQTEKQERLSDSQDTKQWLEKLQGTQDTMAQNLAALTALQSKTKNDP